MLDNRTQRNYRVAGFNAKGVGELSDAVDGGVQSAPLAPRPESIIGQMYQVCLTWDMPPGSAQPPKVLLHRTACR